MSIIDLLADKLIDNNSEKVKSVEELKKQGCVLSFYFASSWCEPCLAFTQLLISFYEDMLIKYEKKKSIKDTNKFEVVFVSSDLNEEGFSESIKEMPWSSVSYKHCHLRKKLSKRFNVKEIPCLVLVDGESGRTINTKGRDSLLEDLNGDNFPWNRPPVMKVLGTEFVVGGELRDCSDLLKNAYIGIYFSAHWCPPCRHLTTHLIQVYNHLKKQTNERIITTLQNQSDQNQLKDENIIVSKNQPDHKFEVIFISSDRSLDSYEEYCSTMPWLMLPYQHHTTKPITKYFDVQGIPALILLDPDHNIISSNARTAVFNDPTAKHFPWSSEQPEELTESSIEHLHNSPCLILFTEGRKELISSAREVLETGMQAYHQQCRLSIHDVTPLLPLRVFYEGAQSDEVADSVRSFAQIDGREPLVAIVEGGRVLRGSDNQLDPPSIQQLIEKFKVEWVDEGSGED